jgi:hypothetical protein
MIRLKLTKGCSETFLKFNKFVTEMSCSCFNVSPEENHCNFSFRKTNYEFTYLSFQFHVCLKLFGLFVRLLSFISSVKQILLN